MVMKRGPEQRQPLRPSLAADAPTRLADVNGTQVEYRLTPGTRGTVVVFHGGHLRAGLPLGESAFRAAGYCVLTPSRPGYGRTPLSAGPDPARFAATAAALCQQLGVTPVLAVVGVSAGGPTAVAMAALHPTLVASLVLHSARSSLPFPDGLARLVAPAAFHPRLERASWSAVRRLMRQRPHLGLRLMMASLSTLPPHSVVDDLSRDEQELLVSTFSRMRSGRGFRNDVRQRAAVTLERQVTQPALVVASASDGQVRWKHAEQLGRSLPHATTWTSPSLSHLIWFGSGGDATHHRTQTFLSGL